MEYAVPLSYVGIVAYGCLALGWVLGAMWAGARRGDKQDSDGG